MVSSHPTWIEIDLIQFRKNLSFIRSLIGTAKLCLPVKANAYGHGLIGIARAAVDLVDCLAVSCAQEGVRLRQAGIQIPILVLGAIHDTQIDDLICYNLEFSISSQFKADLVAKKNPPCCRIHLEVETGMQRTGVRPETAIPLMQHIKTLGCFEVAGVYSHLATSDAREQIATFKKMLSHPVFQGIPAHIASSGAVLHHPEAHFDMVRPGILAYGYAGLGSPCFSLKSRVAYFKVVEAGLGVGYGHTYMTKARTRIVTIPIGYGDGYRRALSNRGSVLIRGQKFPIVGNICMDQLMVDVGGAEIFVGDEVVLIGKQGNEEILLQEVATLCDTIPYEVLCLLNERIARIYAPF